MHDEMSGAHLAVEEVAGYVDRQLGATERARVEDHLAACAECRAEVVAVGRLARSFRQRRRWVVSAPLAAAAAVLLLTLVPWGRISERSTPILREPAITTTAAPTPIGPLGAVTALPPLTWTSVPHADRYQVTVFDTNGSLVWETQTADTVAVVPRTITLRPGAPYFWKVAGRTGWDRWVASDLTTFTVGTTRPSR